MKKVGLKKVVKNTLSNKPTGAVKRIVKNTLSTKPKYRKA